MSLGIPPLKLEGDLEARWVVLALHQASWALRFDLELPGALISGRYPVPLAEQRRRGTLGEISMHRSQPDPQILGAQEDKSRGPQGHFS